MTNSKIYIANWQCAVVGIPAPEPEYRFHPVRKWLIDYAWPNVKLAVEIEGGIWSKGRHIRPAGFLRDMEKYNALTGAGWTLLRFQPRKVDMFEIADAYKRLMGKGVDL